MNYVIIVNWTMKKIIKITSLALIAIALVASGCSATKKHSCGCTGMVGYK
jgi:hypothetical protein